MMTKRSPLRIAYFVSPHGFGHAARAAAVMEALGRLRDIQPGIEFEIFTSVPEWFFNESLSVPYHFHPVVTDVGLVQTTPFKMDLAATVARLDDCYPPPPAPLTQWSRQLLDRSCRLVVCDIAPLGIAVARAAGLPSLLIENFTWDWIYAPYVAREPGFGRHIDGLRALFGMADYRIQTEPLCLPEQRADLLAPPVSRSARRPSDHLRRELGIAGETKIVLVTMGGIPAAAPITERFKDFPDLHFIIPDGRKEDHHPHTSGNVTRLPHRSRFYHPDLVAASDVVIGKLGYSTIAEVFHAGAAFGYVARADFRESAPLEAFVAAHIPGCPISPAAFAQNAWFDHLPYLLSQPRVTRATPNGAALVAPFMLNLLN